MKRFIFGIFTAALLFFCVPAFAADAHPFTDVSSEAWYAESVARAYSFGIVNGVGGDLYEPDAALTMAECIKMAACIHQRQTNGVASLKNGTERWYDPYVSYALEKKLLSAPCSDYEAIASRAWIATVFARLIGEKETLLNDGERRYCDVMDEEAAYYDDVYKMYRYGVMIGDENGRFHPEDGVTRGEIAAVVVRILDASQRIAGEISLAGEVRLPILMYHNFAEQATDYTVTAAIFESHLSALKNAGYTAVTFADVIAYADGRNNLPEKPVLLTSDDGYVGVLDVALPLLEAYDMRMSVAVIGEHIGRKEEGTLPHFSLEEATERDTENRIELISHTWGLHKIENGMKGATNESLSETEYVSALSADCAVMRELAEGGFPMLAQVFVYPYGSFTTESETLLAKEGYRATVTTESGVAVLAVGEGLGLLPRITAEWYATGDALLRRLQ